MPNIERVEIRVTAENLWFLERYLNVFDCMDLFPADAISKDERRGVPIRLHTDREFVIESDIDGSKMQLRSRSKHKGWVRWTQEHGLRAGDRIIVEKTGDRDFALSLLRGEE
ncbi:MAG: hypothetical protein ACOZB3_10800 [Calditrichota bacterium]